MAAQTANVDREIKAVNHVDHPVAAATTIFAGAMVCTNAAHNAVAASDGANLKFAGIAKDKVANTGSAGDKDVICIREGVVKLATAATFAVGDLAVVLDDNTVTTAAIATNDVAVGRVVKVISGFVWVDIRVKQ